MQKTNQEKTVRLFNDVRVTHYPVKQTHIQIMFEFKNGAGNFNGNVFEYKFKDPRDALKYFITRFENYHPIIGKMIYNYIESNIPFIQYTPLELYYIEIMKFKIPFATSFFIDNPIIKNIISFDKGIKEELNQEELLELNKEFEEVYFKYKKEMNTITRMAHLWVVSNTWYYYNLYYNIFFSHDVNSLKESKHIDAETINNEDIEEIQPFIYDDGLWKIINKKGDWVIAFDAGNGWYKQMTKENSYKLII